MLKNALFKYGEKVSQYLIPYCTYTEPEIATVGLNEKQLKKQGILYDSYTKHFDHNDRALCESKKGVYKVYTKKGSDVILGASLAGGPAGDLIGTVAAAMHNKVGLQGLGASTFPYPSYAEIFRQMGDAIVKQQYGPKMKSLIRAIFF